MADPKWLVLSIGAKVNNFNLVAKNPSKGLTLDTLDVTSMQLTYLEDIRQGIWEEMRG